MIHMQNQRLAVPRWLVSAFLATIWSPDLAKRPPQLGSVANRTPQNQNFGGCQPTRRPLAALAPSPSYEMGRIDLPPLRQPLNVPLGATGRTQAIVASDICPCRALCDNGRKCLKRVAGPLRHRTSLQHVQQSGSAASLDSFTVRNGGLEPPANCVWGSRSAAELIALACSQEDSNLQRRIRSPS